MSSRRVIIVDVSHLFYKFMYGGSPALTAVINIDGVPKVVDTTLPALTIKTLHRWSNGGHNPLVVCFDSAGCAKGRKGYFLKNSVKTGTSVDYKSTRDSQNSSFYEGINMTFNLLRQAGVNCLSSNKFEADDLIKAAVDKAKADYPDLPIDIVTGDQDIIPLVDDQVSVFLSSKKLTWAESSDIEKRHYVQLQPHNYQSYIEGLTEFKGLLVPYNTALLKKLIRGKKADDIPAYPKFTPTKYNKLINDLIFSNYDLGNLFRYDAPIKEYVKLGTEETVPEDKLDTVDKNLITVRYKDPATLTNMCNVLSNFVDDGVIEHIRFIYNGVNLNCAFDGIGADFDRRPCRLTSDIKGYNAADLQQAVEILKINLPIM